MRTLVCYTGNARSFSQLWANHAFWLWSRVPNPTFVVSVADDPQAEDMKAIQHAMPEAPFFFEKVVQPDMEEPRQPCLYHSGNKVTSSVQGVLKQLWALNRVWEFAQESGVVDEACAVIRVRPDSLFMDLALPSKEEHGHRIWPNECLTPAWSRWGGVNDRFAVMGMEAAGVYFGTVRQRQALWKKWCPLHPETMIGFNLKEQGIHLGHLPANFCTLRMPDAAHHTHWVDPQVVSPLDLLHAQGV